MILTINLNPVLEKNYYMEELLPRVVTKADKTIYKSGGACIITSQILNNLNSDVVPIGFLGGLSGKYIYNDLSDRGINSNFTETKDETQSAISIIENNVFLSKIIEDMPRVTREEVGSLYEVYKNFIPNYNIICGTGSIPTGAPEEIYFDLIQLANREDKKFLMDAQGIELKYGIEAKPFMVKLNKYELENLTNLELNFENEIIKAANYILDKEIEIVVIDLDRKGSIVLCRDMGYRLEVDHISLEKLSIDEGYTVAGYAYGLDKDYDLDMIMKLGQAFRIVYGLVENIDDIDMSEIKKIMSRINIMPIYY